MLRPCAALRQLVGLEVKRKKVNTDLIYSSVRKHTYSDILKLSPPKSERFQIKILAFFKFQFKTDSEYSLELPLLGGSNEYPQSML